MSKLDEIERAIIRFDELLYYDDGPPVVYASRYLKLLLPIARVALEVAHSDEIINAESSSKAVELILKLRESYKALDEDED